MVGDPLQVADDIQKDHTALRVTFSFGKSADMFFPHLPFQLINALFQHTHGCRRLLRTCFPRFYRDLQGLHRLCGNQLQIRLSFFGKAAGIFRQRLRQLCDIFCMIPGPFDVTDCIKQVLYLLLLSFCQRKIIHLYQKFRQDFFHTVDIFFPLQYFLCLLQIFLRDRSKCKLQVLAGCMSHYRYFTHYSCQRKERISKHSAV